MLIRYAEDGNGCFLGLGMGHICHAYSIAQIISQLNLKRKMVGHPLSPGWYRSLKLKIKIVFQIIL